MLPAFRYDSIGEGYSTTRQEDPVLFRKAQTALGNAHSIVNLGAGGGSYEPRDQQHNRLHSNVSIVPEHRQPAHARGR